MLNVGYGAIATAGALQINTEMGAFAGLDMGDEWDIDRTLGAPPVSRFPALEQQAPPLLMRGFANTTVKILCFDGALADGNRRKRRAGHARLS